MKVSMKTDEENFSRFSIHFDDLTGKEFDTLRCLLVDLHKKAEFLSNKSISEGLSLNKVIKMIGYYEG